MSRVAAREVSSFSRRRTRAFWCVGTGAREIAALRNAFEDAPIGMAMVDLDVLHRGQRRDRLSPPSPPACVIACAPPTPWLASEATAFESPDVNAAQILARADLAMYDTKHVRRVSGRWDRRPAGT